MTAGVGARQGKPTGAGDAAASASFGPWGTQRCRTPSVVGPLQGLCSKSDFGQAAALPDSRAFHGLAPSLFP